MQSLAQFLGLPEDPLDGPDHQDPDLAWVELTGAAFCEALVNSREYRLCVARRALAGVLPPAIEGRVLDHAWGKPIDRIEVKDTTNALDGLTPAQLRLRLRDRISTLETLVDLLDDPAESVVH